MLIICAALTPMMSEPCSRLPNQSTTPSCKAVVQSHYAMPVYHTRVPNLTAKSQPSHSQVTIKLQYKTRLPSQRIISEDQTNAQN